MNLFQYILSPNINHTSENKNNDINQTKFKITKERKMVKSNGQRPKFKLRENYN